MTNYDVIVIGTGGVGSAALFQLAKRGLHALGLDRFPGGHDRGSSHGQTRMIRQAYFEHPDYVPLLKRAYDLWEDFQQCCGRKLFFKVGLIEIGPPDGVVISGVLESAQRHHLAVERLSRDEVHARYPAFVLPEGGEAVFEAEAGYLLVEQCVRSHLAEAKKLGAEIVDDQSVLSWQCDGAAVHVRTNQDAYQAASLIVTAGAWAAQLLTDLRVPFRVLRKHLHWYKNEDLRLRDDHGCPAFFYDLPDGYFYGFPQIDDDGLKVAEHSGGTAITDPLNDDRAVEESDRWRVEAFLDTYLPTVSHQPTRHTVCYYTMTPDEHFIIDRHPEHTNVAFAAGLSGHGFKFTPVLGEILADLVIDGATSMPAEFLKLERFLSH